MVEVRCKVGNGNAFTNLHRGLGMPERVWGMARDPGVRARVPHRHPEHLPGRAGEHFASEVRSSGDSVVPISSMSHSGQATHCLAAFVFPCRTRSRASAKSRSPDSSRSNSPTRRPVCSSTRRASLCLHDSPPRPEGKLRAHHPSARLCSPLSGRARRGKVPIVGWPDNREIAMKQVRVRAAGRMRRNEGPPDKRAL